MPMERFKELVEWLDKSPFTIHNLDLEGILEKGDVNLKIVAPKISKIPKENPPQ
jgi:hypothetical protein